jgi:hypothetical protein
MEQRDVGWGKSRWQAVKIRLSITKSRNHAISNQRIHVVSICTTIPVASLPCFTDGQSWTDIRVRVESRDINSIFFKCF